MSEAPALSLAVGDRVVYPNQGICRVTSVEAREVAGQTLTFVTMRREEDGAVVMVPQGKIRSIGLRKVSSAGDVDQVFEFLNSESDKTTLDWKQRARNNLDRMSTGGLQGLAEVVKGLQVLSELRPLPTKERELYDNARHLLVSEISASIGIPACDAEDAIDIILFVPGKERPKRTAEEFRQRGEGEDDELGELGDDLLGLGGDLDVPGVEGDEAPAEEAEGAEAEADEGEEEAKPRKAPKKAPAAAAPDAPKRKRGRPPKPKPEGPPPPPKKRGRPPKAKPAVATPPPPPKKRGRPPKAKPAAPASKPKKK